MGGIVAAGNIHTAEAAAEILSDGGNAFDAAVAALLTACVSEPVLTSLGGGGFLLARSADRKAALIDFFAQTPRSAPDPSELDFYGIDADFGTQKQEFHIGKGSIATPGMVAGLFAVRDTLGSMPMRRLGEPAIRLAKEGHNLDPLQAQILDVVKPVVMASEGARRCFTDPEQPQEVLEAGSRIHMPEFADFADELTREGPRFFYEGPVAAVLEEWRNEGGTIGRNDLSNYTVKHRNPLEFEVSGARLLTNPPPSVGGSLVAFALMILDRLQANLLEPQSPKWLSLLAATLAETGSARTRSGLASGVPGAARQLLNEAFMTDYFASTESRARKIGGTTHISVADDVGNLAAVTVSNGEGCGHFIPDTGIHMNNMLGEEDTNPGGFFKFTPDSRVASMMTPTILEFPDGRAMALGSGGSNRIRSAITQTVSQLTFFDADPEHAVSMPRVHLEGEHLNLEAGFDERTTRLLAAAFPEHTVWPDQSFFFGGVHITEFGTRGLRAAADQRRAGAVIEVQS